MRRCPVCMSLLEQVWEYTCSVNRGQLWTGRYTCEYCGVFRATGIERDKVRTIIQWTPGCPIHGTEPVHLVGLDNNGNDYEWACSTCYRRLQNRAGKIRVSWKPYEPVFLDAAMVDAAVSKLEVQHGS